MFGSYDVYNCNNASQYAQMYVKQSLLYRDKACTIANTHRDTQICDMYIVFNCQTVTNIMLTLR